MPEIRFYWNGFKVYPAAPDCKLTKAYYVMHNDETIEIFSEDVCKGVPQRLFPALEGISYFPTQYAYVPETPERLADWTSEIEGVLVYPDHPLYRHVAWAYYKSAVRNKKQYIRANQSKLEDPRWLSAVDLRERIEKAREELEELEYRALATGSNGRPNEYELEAVDALARLFIRKFNDDQKAERKAREDAVREQTENGTKFILFVSDLAPIKDGEPVVTIRWSEHPAFYHWGDDELKLSVPAADLIFKYFDKPGGSAGCGYDKTSFIINYTDPESGEPSEYTGRYDIGDCDGGLIEHIRPYSEDAADYFETFIPKTHESH